MSFRLVLKSVTLSSEMVLTLHDLTEFDKPFQLIIASSSIELIDQKSASITHYDTAVKLVCVNKLAHLRVEWISALLTFNLSFRFTVVPCCDVWLPVYIKYCDRPMSAAEFMRDSIILCSTCMMSPYKSSHSLSHLLMSFLYFLSALISNSVQLEYCFTQMQIELLVY